MLLVLAILFLILGGLALVLLALANGMSDAPGSRMPVWPAWTLLGASAVCFSRYGMGVPW